MPPIPVIPAFGSVALGEIHRLPVGFHFPLPVKFDLARRGMVVMVVAIIVSRMNDVAGGERCSGHSHRNKTCIELN